MTVVHKCGFLPWMPDAVEALAFPSPSIAAYHPLLACLRSSGDIEIYDGRAGWVARRIPAGGAVAQHIQSIAFLSSSLTDPAAAPILLTAGLDGMVVEWDVSFLRPVRMRMVEGGGIWGMSLSVDEKHLAIASEDGNIRILDVELKGKQEGKRSFKVLKVLKALDEAVKDGKVVSLAWSSNTPGLLAAGSSLGNIIIWKLFDDNSKAKGSILHRINVGSVKLAEKLKSISEKKRRYFKVNDSLKNDITVWSLQFVGGTLVCGDSRGLITYFDPILGVAAGQSSLHKGPVMSIAANPADSRHFFSCGADGMIQGYVNSVTNPSARLSKKDWKSTHHRYPHTHDIRASIYVKLPADRNILPSSHIYRDSWVMFSGGVDGDIAVWRIEGKLSQEPERLSSIPHQPLIKVIPKTKMIVAADMRTAVEDAKDVYLNEARKSVKIWTLGEPDSEYAAFSSAIKSLDIHETPIVSPPRLALEMKVPNEDESIAAIDVNDEGNLVALVTRNRVSLYSLDIVKKTHADKVNSKKRRRVLDPIDSVKVTKVEIPDGLFDESVPQSIRFLMDIDALLTCSITDGPKVEIRAFQVPSFDLKWQHVSDVLTTSAALIQSCSDCIVVVDYEGNIIFLDPLKGTLINKTKTEFPVQAICLIPSGEGNPTLIAATSNYVIHQFSPLTDDPEDFHLQIDNLTHNYTRRFEPITGISFVPGSEAISNLRLYSQRNLFVLDLSKPIPNAIMERTLYPKEVHLCRNMEPTFPDTPDGQMIKRIFAENMYKVEKSQDARIMCLQYLGNEEAVWIERSWNEMVSSLPPAIMRKRFGRS